MNRWNKFEKTIFITLDKLGCVGIIIVPMIRLQTINIGITDIWSKLFNIMLCTFMAFKGIELMFKKRKE